MAVKVPSYLIKRRKAHFHSLPCGAGLIIGCNGMIWICERFVEFNVLTISNQVVFRLAEDVDGGYNVDLTAHVSDETMKVLN